jgi:hypothetical protein
MNEQEPRRLPNGLVDVDSYLTENGREPVPMGVNADGSQTYLEGYLTLEGIQIPLDRLDYYLEQLVSEKKPNDNGVLDALRRYLGGELLEQTTE